MATYTEQLQQIVTKYVESGEEWPATSRQKLPGECTKSFGNRILHRSSANVRKRCRTRCGTSTLSIHKVAPYGRNMQQGSSKRFSGLIFGLRHAITWRLHSSSGAEPYWATAAS